MAKPQKPEALILPSFKIKEVFPALEKNNKIYARLIHGTDRNERPYIMRERTGLIIENYIGRALECVAEITKAQIVELDSENSKKLPEGAIPATFIGWDTGYKFFPELVAIIEGETGNPEIDEDFDEDEYDELASKLFKEWGIYSFGLDVYRDKPMLKTENGTFFLNEYIFKEYIDNWEQSVQPEKEKIGIIIEELLLYGIKECEWDIKPLHTETTASPNEMIIRGGWSVLDPY